MNMNRSDDDKCRLCLSEHDKSDLTPIFAEAPGLSLAARMMICLSLPVQPGDSFPDTVCKTCEHHVTQFYTFKQTCLNAYYSLLERANVYNVDEKFCNFANRQDANSANFALNVDNFDDNTDRACIKLGREKLDISKTKPEKKFFVGYDSRHNDERTSVPHLQNDPLADEIVPINVECNMESANFVCSFMDRTNEKLHKELTFVDTATEIIRYKCLRCDHLFSDINTASAHCAQCCRTDDEYANNVDHRNEIVERTEGEEYLDENLAQKNVVNAEEPRSPSWPSSMRKHSSPRFHPDRKTSPATEIQRKPKVLRLKSPSILRKREIREIKTNHSCPACESVFTSAALLRRHMVVHTGERPYECPICQKRFSQVGQLNFHKNFHENPRYRCEICKKPFLRPSDIEKHMRTHTGEKPYGCTICSKSFAQLVALQQHERIHTGDKPFVCEICNKRFSQKANKTKHVKIHKEGAKPYTCGICGRSFSDLGEMMLHRAGHGGGKPRKCDHCEESFRKMSELSQHTRRYHTFEKPHKCAFCQKGFYSLYNLKQHVMVHTGQKPYSCSLCDLKFTQKGNLTKHFERKHAERVSNDDGYIVGIKEEAPLIIEREETVELETIDDSIDHNDLQTYNID